jgi:hypothetical protein
MAVVVFTLAVVVSVVAGGITGDCFGGGNSCVCVMTIGGCGCTGGGDAVKF